MYADASKVRGIVANEAVASSILVVRSNILADGLRPSAF